MVIVGVFSVELLNGLLLPLEWVSRLELSLEIAEGDISLSLITFVEAWR